MNCKIKKIALEHNSSIQVPGNANGLSGPQRCNICNNDFTGPIPYEDHLGSKGHTKNVQKIEFLKEFQSTVPVQSDSTTAVPNYATRDVKIHAESSGVNREWYCEICMIPTSGPEPYRQHLHGKLHLKNVNSTVGIRYIENMRESSANANLSQNRLSENEQNLTHFINGDKTNEYSKDLRISRDLILCDALKDIAVVVPEDLNITIFYPDDEIVFDNNKKNKYNDKNNF